MDFKKTGIPQYSINDSFRKFQESLENVTTIGFGSIRGDLVLDGNNYLIGVDQNEITGEIECVEVASLFHGDTFEGIDLTNMSAESFAQELAKIGSTPVVEIDNVWWPKEHMAFYVHENTPSTICWWGNTTDAEVQEIFSQGQENFLV
ncbi:MAG: hypothetical protein ACFNVT_00920 [Corynebacterium matruchotii]|uniref:hypothetical protein n=1 Tax=Corynebacterium matruchotii TaxID=43768 RepID=UPI0028D225E3|nr:hypothetical protein [Corynebacterium matruchotii]